MSWLPENNVQFLFDVYSGSVEVKLDGLDVFTANARDLLHIPKFVAGSIKMLEDTVLFDVGCQGHLLRLMDELQAYKVREPAKLQEEGFMLTAMKKNNYYIQFKAP